MNAKRLVIALYRAIYCLNEENFNADMESFLSDADPYIFTDRISADPAFQEEFEKSLPQNIEYDKTDVLYDCVYDYLRTHTFFSEQFTQISKSEWSTLCMIVDEECDNENILM